MAIFIHGVEYVPKPDAFTLTALHFETAAKLADPFAAIKWAFDTQSTVSQMESWSRQNHPEPTPEPAQKKKPPRQLFGD
jgi:hypothetical protein